MGCVMLSYILKNGQDFNTGSAGGAKVQGLTSPACVQEEENMQFN